MMEMIFKIMWKSPDTIYCLSFYIKLFLECFATILQNYYNATRMFISNGKFVY